MLNLRKLLDVCGNMETSETTPPLQATSLDVRIDYRERDLLSRYESRTDNTFLYTTANLAVGDIAFYKDSVLSFILERKTLADLAASIKDGRYRSQFARMRKTLPTRACCYVIEGFPPVGTQRMGGLPLTTLYSSMMHKVFRDGCCVYRTRDLNETAEFVEHLAKEWRAGRLAHLEKSVGDTGLLEEAPTKSKATTDSDCYLAMLCQIPKVSLVKARVIMGHHSTFQALMKTLLEAHDPPTYLQELRPTAEGRRLGPAVAKSICQHLGF